MRRKKKSSLPAIVAVMAIFAGALALLMALSPGTMTGRNDPDPVIGGTFELVDSQGKPVRDTDFRGHYFLVYFGYTFCPDVCPTSLNTIAEAFDRLSPEKLAHVEALFVSVDPDRDHGEVLDSYTENFHEKIKGATGTRQQIDAMIAKYRGTYRIGESDDPEYYPVDHSSLIYLMDDKGKYVTYFTHQTTVDKLVQTLNETLPD